MNAAATTCGNGKRKLLKQAALPLPFAVRAERSIARIPTCLQPANGGHPNRACNSISPSGSFQPFWLGHPQDDKSIAC